MSPPIPPREPLGFVSGDTVLWTKVLADYPLSDGWTLNYRLVGDVDSIDATSITVNADTELGGWDVTIPAAKTGSLHPGVYRLIGWVLSADTTERHTICDRAVNVLVDITTGEPSVLQSPDKQMLLAIEARLTGRLSGDQEQVHINGTSIMRIPMKELMAYRGIYAAKVWREEHRGQAFPSIATRMTKPGPVNGPHGAADDQNWWSVP